MAKFRDSLDQMQPHVQMASSGTAESGTAETVEMAERSIGSLIAETRNLSAEQIEAILRHQRDHGVRFGEAAVAMGYATADDVMFALAQQFHYPYVQEEKRKANPELVTLNQPFGVQAETFRAIRSQLMMRLYNEGRERRAIAVVSPDVGDGRTYFAANLAITLAQLGGRTLLVDADMRNPRQHQLFGVANSAGLTGILSGRIQSQVIHRIPDVPSLFLMPVGVKPPNPQELVEREAFGLLVRDLLTKFDHVIVDTSASALGSDCAVVAARCRASLIVARRNTSRVAALQSLVANLAETPARLLGTIVNDV